MSQLLEKPTVPYLDFDSDSSFFHLYVVGYMNKTQGFQIIACENENFHGNKITSPWYFIVSQPDFLLAAVDTTESTIHFARNGLYEYAYKSVSDSYMTDFRSYPRSLDPCVYASVVRKGFAKTILSKSNLKSIDRVMRSSIQNNSSTEITFEVLKIHKALVDSFPNDVLSGYFPSSHFLLKNEHRDFTINDLI